MIMFKTLELHQQNKLIKTENGNLSSAQSFHSVKVRLFILLSIVCFSLVPLIIGCSSNKYPQIVFKKHNHEFSEVFIAGSTVVHVFSFTNEGNATLQIEDIVTDCGCVATNVSSNHIPAGGNGNIRVEVQRDDEFAGHFLQNVRVFTNDPNNAMVNLQVRGTILTPLTYPKKIELGQLEKGKRVSKKIRFTNNLKKAVEITEHTVSNKGITITLPKKSIPGSDSMECEAVLTMNDVGYYDESLTITAQAQQVLPHTDSKEFEIAIQFQGRVLGGIVVLPQNLFLGVLDGSGKSFQKKIQLKTDANQPFALEKISADKFSVAATLAKEPQTAHEVMLSITPKVGSYSFALVEGTIQIFTTHPHVPKITIPIKAVTQ